jgi:hypothetical protein
MKRTCINKLFVNLFTSAIIIVVVNTVSHAQVRVTGGFLSDSLKIGDRTAFFLAAKYPSDLAVLFPDSTHNFFPFELEEKKYFTTETSDGVSVDSTVFYFTTFEIDSTLILSLPAYVISNDDSTMYRSNADSIKVIHTVAETYDSLTVEKLPLKMNTTYQPVSSQFNWIVLLLAFVVLLLIGVIVWIIFGKRISRYLRARKLEKRHQQFVEGFTAVTADVQRAFSPVTAETALSMWKKYMEQLEAKPYTKLTTRETYALNHDDVLGRNLSAIDRAIYGSDRSIVEPLSALKSVADERFTKKLMEVKHGK